MKKVTAVVLRINPADAEFRLGVSNAQLSDTRRELADTKTLLTDTQVTLLECLDDLAVHRSQAESLRNDRDNVLRALNSARDLLDRSFPTFSLDSEDIFSSVETFASSVSLCLPNQHLRAMEERDEYCIANAFLARFTLYQQL